MKKIYLSAGELSGDRYGAKLVKELKKLDSTLVFRAIGSDAIASEGVTLLDDLTSISTIGFIEPLKHIFTLLYSFKRMKKCLATEKPDVFIPIDFQGFNMPLVKAAYSLGVPSAYFITPQVWQWGSKKSGQKVAHYTTLLLSIFREEIPYFKSLGGRAKFIGHPILDIVTQAPSKDNFCARYGLNSKHPIIALFPGSREQEIKHTAPTLLKAAAQFQRKWPNTQLCIGAATQSLANALPLSSLLHKPPTIIINDTHALITHSLFSFCSSGTITLEHTVLGTPFITAYRFSPLSYLFISLFFKKKFQQRVGFFSLPNILLKESLIPEFLQDDATPEKIVTKANILFTDHAYRNNIIDGLARAKKHLGEPGAIKRAAKLIIDLIHDKS